MNRKSIYAQICGGLLAFLLLTCWQVEGRADSIKLDVTVAAPVFGRYFPAVSTNPDAVPREVSDRASSYIAERFDITVLSNIHLNRYCIVEPEKVRSAGFRTIEKPWYALIYSVRLQHDKLGSYEFRIDIDVSGRILNQPGIPVDPCVRTLSFLPLRAITDIATKELVKWDDLRVQYVAKYDALVWRFTRTEASFWRADHSRGILVDACSGRILERFEFDPMNASQPR